MKTLKSWWAFANDETTLSDAEIVAKGDENWSPLAEQALRESALMIVDRVGPESVPTFWDPKTWALEHHPQAFEELSLAIGEALERMWAVVPEAKREEPPKRSGAEEYMRFGPNPMAQHAADAAAYAFHGTRKPGKSWASQLFRREYLGEWVQPAEEDIVLPEAARGETLTFSNRLPEPDPAKLRQQMIENIQALHDSVVGTPSTSGDWTGQAIYIEPSDMTDDEAKRMVDAGYDWNEPARRWEHAARIGR